MWGSHYKTINAATAEDMPWDALPTEHTGRRRSHELKPVKAPEIRSHVKEVHGMGGAAKAAMRQAVANLILDSEGNGNRKDLFF